MPAGLEAAQAGRIVTFGIKPTEPKTSYGYIRRGKAIGPKGVYAVEAFVEKPDAETAARYVSEGYLWNSGNFLFRADVLLAELQRYEPAMAAAVEAAVAERQRRPRLPAARSGGVRQRAAEVDRLRGDGEDRPRGGGRGQIPLVRYRLLGRDLRHRDRMTRPAMSIHGAVVAMDTQQLRDPQRRPAGRRARRAGPGGGLDRPMRCW